MQEIYAFIDVQNTASTTKKLLGFIIDWRKLCDYLNKKWRCNKENIFVYAGIDEGDDVATQEFDSLLQAGYTIRNKRIFSYKKPDKNITVKCVHCGKDNVEVVDMGYNRKSNCDVDLTVDAMEKAGPDKVFLLFTGDGDFEYLVRSVINKGTKVHLVSSNAGVRNLDLVTKRFSTRFKKIIRENRGTVNFINIDSWKMKIRK